MPFDCNLPAGHCLFDSGLAEALEHKWHETRRYGEDLGLLFVRDWCRRHWPTFQRFRRIEHLLGEKSYIQFSDSDFGKWKHHERVEGSVFDLVLGVFECGMENLQFVDWASLHRLSREEAYELFITLDPNCVRMDYSPIIQRARERLILA